MKIKNSKENLSLRMLFPVMYVATLVLVVLRSFQLTRYIDSATGFLTGGYAVNFLLYGIIAVACLFFIAVSFLSYEGKEVELVGLKDKKALFGAIAFGLSMIYDSFDSFFDSVMIFDGVSVYDYPAAEVFKTLMATGALPYAFQSIFALFSAVYIFILAKSFSKGNQAAHKSKLLALAPIAWAAFKLITRFVKQISYIKVSDLLLELIMLAFMILFFVALSQVVSGVYSDDSRWRITALGLSGALVSLATNVPRLIMSTFASDFVNKEYPFSLDDTMFAVFAIFVALAACKTVQENRRNIQQ